jgi:hypothetical protein
MRRPKTGSLPHEKILREISGPLSTGIASPRAGTLPAIHPLEELDKLP